MLFFFLFAGDIEQFTGINMGGKTLLCQPLEDSADSSHYVGVPVIVGAIADTGANVDPGAIANVDVGVNVGATPETGAIANVGATPDPGAIANVDVGVTANTDAGANAEAGASAGASDNANANVDITSGDDITERTDLDDYTNSDEDDSKSFHEDYDTENHYSSHDYDVDDNPSSGPSAEVTQDNPQDSSPEVAEDDPLHPNNVPGLMPEYEELARESMQVLDMIERIEAREGPNAMTAILRDYIESMMEESDVLSSTALPEEEDH